MAKNDIECPGCGFSHGPQCAWQSVVFYTQRAGNYEPVIWRALEDAENAVKIGMCVPPIVPIKVQTFVRDEKHHLTPPNT